MAARTATAICRGRPDRAGEPRHADAQPPGKSTKNAVAGNRAYLTGFLGVAIAVASLAMFLSYRGTTGAQIDLMRQALARAQSSSASSYGSLNGKLNATEAMISGLAPLAAFNMNCSQDLTGPNGAPTQFFMPCTDQKP
jgi:hypothetical protein